MTWFWSMCTLQPVITEIEKHIAMQAGNRRKEKQKHWIDEEKLLTSMVRQRTETETETETETGTEIETGTKQQKNNNLRVGM